MENSLEFCRERMKIIADELDLSEGEKEEIEKMFIQKKDWEDNPS